MLVNVLDYEDKDEVMRCAASYADSLLGRQCVPAHDESDYPTLFNHVVPDDYFTKWADTSNDTYVQDFISINADGRILGLFHVQFHTSRSGFVDAFHMYTNRFIKQNSMIFSRDLRRFHNYVQQNCDTATMVPVKNTAFFHGMVGPGDVPIYPKMPRDGVVTSVGFVNKGGTKNVLEYYSGQEVDSTSTMLCRDGETRPCSLWTFVTERGIKNGLKR